MSDPDPPQETSRTQSAAPWQQFACDARSSQRGATWIRVRGELDLATAPQLERTISEALPTSLLIIIDLRLLTFIDSTGIHRIIEADSEARRRGRRLVFIRGPAQVDRMFRLVGLSDRLRVIDLEPGVAPAPTLFTPSPADAA